MTIGVVLLLWFAAGLALANRDFGWCACFLVFAAFVSVL